MKYKFKVQMGWGSELTKLQDSSMLGVLDQAHVMDVQRVGLKFDLFYELDHNFPPITKKQLIALGNELIERANEI